MINIKINNSVCKVSGDRKETLQLYKAFKIRHPNAYHLRAYMPKGWDGCIDFIKESGNFDTGLLHRVVLTAEELGYKVKLEDLRDKGFLKKAKVPKRNEAWEYRGYQLEAIQALVDFRVKKKFFPRGTQKIATHGGKLGISVGIYFAYKQPTIFLMNSTELFNQALKELPELLGEEPGQISSKKIEWAPFMVAMVATLRNRLPQIMGKLTDYKVLIVDECDLANNKTNKKVIQALHTAVVRVGLSGTINASKLKQDQVKNLNLEGFFGPQIYEITNRTLIDEGVSSEVAVRMVIGNTDYTPYASWQDEYNKVIVNNKKRDKRVLKRSIYHWDKGRKNQLIIAQRHEHIINLYNLYLRAIKKGILPEGTIIDWVHHARKDRKQVVDKFEAGEIDILIGSMILKRGKNFKKMKFMINAGGGKAPENVLQLLGRNFRGCEYYEDMLDAGDYVSRHSRRRYTYYKNEKLKVSLPKSINNLNNLNDKLVNS